MTKIWGALALAASMALTACGIAERKAPEPVASVASGTTASTTPSGSTETAEAPGLPDGYVWHTIDDVSLRFAIPETWTAINPKKLLAEGDSAVWDQMAKRMGVSSSQMKALVGATDLMVMAPPKDGYADNVTGLVVPFDGLPTEAQLTAQLGQMTDSEVTVTTGDSPAGPTISADYTLTVNEATVRGRSLFVESEDGVLNLAVSALDAALVEKVSEALRSTLHTV